MQLVSLIKTRATPNPVIKLNEIKPCGGFYCPTARTGQLGVCQMSRLSVKLAVRHGSPTWQFVMAVIAAPFFSKLEQGPKVIPYEPCVARTALVS